MNLRLTKFTDTNTHISVTPMSSTFTIKYCEIPRLVLFLVKAYVRGKL